MKKIQNALQLRLRYLLFETTERDQRRTNNILCCILSDTGTAVVSALLPQVLTLLAVHPNSKRNMSHLIPVRVDATCNTGYRIVDTLLVDKTCLPRPLSEFARTSTTNEAIEANVRILSDTLISDYEVAAIQSAGYRQNYFTGRLALLNVPDLRAEVERQMRRALWDMVDGDASATTAATGSRKKRRKSRADNNVDTDDTTTAEADAKKQKVGDDDDEDDKEDQPTVITDNADNTDQEKDTVGSDADKDGGDDGDGIDKSDLVKINIRIRDDKRKILVLDEFHVDPSLCSLPGGDIVSVAQSIVKDFNLPKDMTTTIVTTILEQTRGLHVPVNLRDAKVKTVGTAGEVTETELSREAPAAFHLA